MNRGLGLMTLPVVLTLFMMAGAAQAAYNPYVIKVGIKTDCPRHTSKEIWGSGTLLEGAGQKIFGDVKFANGTLNYPPADFRFVNVATGAVVFTESEWYWDPWDAKWNTSGVPSGTYRSEAKSSDNSGWITGPLAQLSNIADYHIVSARTSAPAESYYNVKATEHYEVAGTFGFKLVDSTGVEMNPKPACLSYRLEDTDALNDLLKGGIGSFFTYEFKPDTYDEGDVYCFFYYDFNDNTEYNWGESYVGTDEFWVMKRLALAYAVQYSDKLPAAFAGKIDGFFSNATDIVIRKDSADDWRGCVRLSASSKAQFISGAARPDPCDYNVAAQREAHLQASQFTFLNELMNAGGCGYVGAIGVILDGTNGTDDWRAAAIAHEIGHNRGLDHAGHASPQLMHGNVLTAGTDDELLQRDASTYDAGP